MSSKKGGGARQHRQKSGFYNADVCRHVRQKYGFLHLPEGGMGLMLWDQGMDQETKGLLVLTTLHYQDASVQYTRVGQFVSISSTFPKLQTSVADLVPFFSGFANPVLKFRIRILDPTKICLYNVDQKNYAICLPIILTSYDT